MKKLYEGKDKTSRFLTSSYASCLVECCRTPLHDLYSAQQSSVKALQLARNEQNQIKSQKMKNVDSWIAV
ncbi:hypothetical protein GXM_07394 [Nostoc sphaeroides CCNUC1]|uniref:Uncharacterized protein n=1 Tax=Nostoc sphaeroides CCNUC1 TaxID=2653204 RepID=A0A5P8WB45_9NOSO|nr:hypothetical protein GXM_07394 [Nostoc sphaeroides CCNUC1]